MADIVTGCGEFARAGLDSLTVERRMVELRMEYGFDLGLNYRIDFTDPRCWDTLKRIGSRHAEVERCASAEGYRRAVGQWIWSDGYSAGQADRRQGLQEVARAACLSGNVKRRPEGIVVSSAFAHQDFAVRFYAWDGNARLGDPTEGVSREAVQSACDLAERLAWQLYREGFRHDRLHDAESQIFAAKKADITLAKAAAVLSEGCPAEAWLV